MNVVRDMIEARYWTHLTETLSQALHGAERKKAVVEIRSSRETDPLGYDGDTLERLRAMARDELAGIGAEAVEEEASVLRARLGLRRPSGAGHE